MRRTCMTTALGLLMTAAAAQGSLLFNGGVADYSNGNEFAQWLQTEDFQLGGNGTLESASFDWFAFDRSTWDGVLEWFIFDDNGGVPGSVVASGNGDNVVNAGLGNVNGWEYFRTDFDFTPQVNVNGSQTYWFGLHLSGDYGTRDDIYWSTSTQSYGSAGIESNGGTQDNWSNNGQHHAFRLYGVPEPTTAVLLAASALTALRRRR